MVKKVNHSIDETLKLFRFSSVLAAWHYMGLQTDTHMLLSFFTHQCRYEYTIFQSWADVIILGLVFNFTGGRTYYIERLYTCVNDSYDFFT